MNPRFVTLVTVALLATLAGGLAPLTAIAAPAPPFNQCPPVGLSPSCGSLLVINPDRSVSVYTDPNVHPFDGVEDTLIGIRNDSAQAVSAITAYGPQGIFGFDRDGLCSFYSPSPSGCPFGPTGYEGPGVNFVTDPTTTADGELDFAGAGIVPGGSAYFSLEGAITAATLKVIVGRLSFCQEAGQMQSQASLSADHWSMNYGISKCEGLVVSQVALGNRLMAERMSLPYLDLVTCSSILGAFPCTGSVTRHITLRPDDVEAQSDPAAYTRVHLLGSGVTSVQSPATSPCNGRPACAYTAVHADYRVDLAPAPAAGLPATYLDITQRYEFYRPFSEKQFKDIACEPSQSAPISFGPLPDCGRWKPLVTYQFHDTTGSTLLLSLNAATRLHFTPDALAVRASTFIRDCDSTVTLTGCQPPGHPAVELFPPDGPGEVAMRKESIIRGLVADPAGTSTLAGRYDNVHQTPSSFVLLPIPPPGCPECAHVHWRWGNSLNAPPFFGDGQPLIGNGEPAAVPNPSSHQQLDVAMVSYHSEELAPANFFQLVQGANPNQLTFTPSSDYSVAGFTRGTETPEHPSGSCTDRAQLTSWGQCGEVLWLSATTSSTVAHDEDKDAFFAFGGFFCEVCGQHAGYSEFVSGLTATYMENKHPSNSRTFAIGSTMTIKFLGTPANVELNDLLPPGLVGVTATQGLADKNGHPLPNVPAPTSCPVTTDSSGRQVVTCETPTGGLGFGIFDQVTITGTVGNIAPGVYSNTVRGIWGSATTNSEPGGNYKNTDDITIA